MCSAYQRSGVHAVFARLVRPGADNRVTVLHAAHALAETPVLPVRDVPELDHVGRVKSGRASASGVNRNSQMIFCASPRDSQAVCVST